MPGLPALIMEYASELPEGALLCPNALVHLGTRTAVGKALSRLAQSGRLLRICRGMYVRPVDTRFGSCPPLIEKVISSAFGSARRDDRTLRRSVGERTWSYEPGSDSFGLPDVWTGPQAEIG